MGILLGVLRDSGLLPKELKGEIDYLINEALFNQ